MGRNPFDINVDSFCQIRVDGVLTDSVGMSLSLQDEGTINEKVYLEGWVENEPDKDTPSGENVPQKLHMVFLMDPATASDLIFSLSLLINPP